MTASTNLDRIAYDYLVEVYRHEFHDCPLPMPPRELEEYRFVTHPSRPLLTLAEAIIAIHTHAVDDRNGLRTGHKLTDFDRICKLPPGEASICGVSFADLRATHAYHPVTTHPIPTH